MIAVLCLEVAVKMTFPAKFLSNVSPARVSNRDFNQATNLDLARADFNQLDDN